MLSTLSFEGIFIDPRTNTIVSKDYFFVENCYLLNMGSKILSRKFVIRKYYKKYIIINILKNNTIKNKPLGIYSKKRHFNK